MGLKKDRIVVVTGASRGAGKGIALALGATGATVYVTGRSCQEGDAELPGTIYNTAAEIDRLGGTGIPVVCDHAEDVQVKALFDRIAKERGRLDILVNNALSVPAGLTETAPFWEKDLNFQEILNVGMRSSYVASYYAAPLLLQNGEGLIVNTSSFGGRCYMHGPAYGAGKAAVDKMAHDMAYDFRPYNVAVVSIWMGLLKTERTLAVLETQPELYEGALDKAESAQFTGIVIDALAKDPDYMQRSGKIWIGAELANEYGVPDIDGKYPPSNRKLFGGPTQYSPAVVE